MLFKKKFLILLSLFLLTFTLLTYQGIKGNTVLSFQWPLYPLSVIERGISYFTRGARKLFNTYVNVVGKEEENRRLTERIKELEEERNRYVEARHENERLRGLLKLKSGTTDYVTTAEVFSRNPSNWFQTIWISKGENKGVAKDMVAVTSRGIVGRVQRVFHDRSTVMLITDINSSVGVRMQSSRIEGVLEGRGDDTCRLKYIPRSVEVKVGEKIVTSGLDMIYPEGLQVGYVKLVQKKPGEFFSEIEVTTAQDLSALEEVALMKR
jgi:rod shape-determining protein MreC